jgi:hypothetical protein
MNNVSVAFEDYDGDPNDFVVNTQIAGLLVDVKLGENFRRKARYFCADGNKTGAPISVTYSTGVSRDFVQNLLLTIAALNDLKVFKASRCAECISHGTE